MIPNEYRELFESDGRIHKIISAPRNYDERRRFARDVRGRHYDVAIAFHANRRSTRWATSARAAVTWSHLHSRTPEKFRGIHAIVGAGVPTSAIERDLNVVRTLGWRGVSPQTEILPSPEARELGLRLLGKRENDRRTVILGIGASRLSKQWPFERLAQLAELLADRDRVIAVYENKSSLIYPDSLKRISRYAQTLQTRSLKELIGVLSLADVYVGNDSGAKHLAAALGSKTLTLFGPESIGEWHGYDSTRHIALRREVVCRNNDPHPPEFAWCGVDTCPFASHACLTTISAQDAYDSLQKL